MERSRVLEGWRRQRAKWSLHLHVRAPSVPAPRGPCSVLITCVCFPRLLNVLCCSLDSFLLLESQYSVSSMLLQSQGENVVDGDGYGPQAQLDTVLQSQAIKAKTEKLGRVGLTSAGETVALIWGLLDYLGHSWPLF